MVTEIVTARGVKYEVGKTVPRPHDTAVVTEIVWQRGDVQEGISGGYEVQLDDGRTIEVNDAVEIWRD
jgi:hypothetical protein